MNLKKLPENFSLNRSIIAMIAMLILLLLYKYIQINVIDELRKFVLFDKYFFLGFINLINKSSIKRRSIEYL